MTVKELSYIDKVEANRGKIKSSNHKYMICDILRYGSVNIKEELTKRKTFGIKLIWEIATALSSKLQDEFLKEVYNGKPTKAKAILIINKIKIKEGL